MSDRQTQAVAEAIHASVTGCPDLWGEMEHSAWYENAKAAIAASDARFIPMLVEAMKKIAEIDDPYYDYPAARVRNTAREALAALPEEYRQ